MAHNSINFWTFYVFLSYSGSYNPSADHETRQTNQLYWEVCLKLMFMYLSRKCWAYYVPILYISANTLRANNLRQISKNH